MSIPLKLTGQMMKQLFPDAKEGDKFQAEIEGSFAMGESGELEPSIDTFEGQSVSPDEMEAPSEAAAETPDQEAQEGDMTDDMGADSQMGSPSASPAASQAKNDLVSKLKAIRGDKVNQKYA